MESLPKLGVGLAYQGPLRPFIENSREEFDCVEIVPDILWTDLGPGKSLRYVEDSAGVDFLRQVRAHRFVIPHSIGLSIGSAHRFEREHTGQLLRWYDWLRFPWHSDHLAYHLAKVDGREVNAGITVPLPRDMETIELLVPRISDVKSQIPIPFLLENNVYYFDIPRSEMDEAAFLNLLCENTGCRLLLDLHNVYVNARNHGFDCYQFLDRLHLENVGEIHVAGGMELDGFYLDAHSSPIPEPVWKLLDWTLPQCPNVGAVIFELFGSWFAEVGEERLRSDLQGMKNIWVRHQPTPERMSI